MALLMFIRLNKGQQSTGKGGTVNRRVHVELVRVSNNHDVFDGFVIAFDPLETTMRC
jgi:hypothetical protein